MVIKASSSKSKNEEYPAFTNFTIKVDVEAGSWADTVRRIQNSVKGVTNFIMEENGKINISGYIDPTLLLKCLRKEGKKAQIVHWQYGECSTNLVSLQKPTTEPSIINTTSLLGYPAVPWGGPYNNNNNNMYGYNLMMNGFNGIIRNNNHLGHCAGNASDCSAHHIQRKKKKPQQLKSSSSSSTTRFQKLKASRPTTASCCSIL